MRLGFSYWGFCESFEDCKEAKTPDGVRYSRPIFVKQMIKSGHSVIALQKQREKKKYQGLEYSSEFPDIDTLFIEWRWPTYKNFGEKKFEPDFDRQSELLSYYHGKIPVVLWDSDHKITPEDEIRWPSAIIADHSLNPKFLTRKRERLLFWTDWQQLLSPSSDSFEYGYIGNNYERSEAFQEFYSSSAKSLREFGVQTSVQGNWLEVSPERESPAVLLSKHPYVSFIPRVGFYESMKRLNSFICTTHIAKPEYMERGAVTSRYVESLAAGVPALVPHDFLIPDILGKDWIVSSSEEVIKKVKFIKNLTHSERVSLVQYQRDKLKDFGLFSVENAVNFFESLS